MGLSFPDISPVALEIGPFAVRWYSLAYLAGILISWGMVRRYCRREQDTFTPKLADDFVVWAVLAILLGGRIGYVLFYNAGFYLRHPMQILYIWEGGMSFHGAVLALIAALLWFCRKHRISPVRSGDLVCTVAPIGLFLGRLANFVNGELYGRKAPDFVYAFVFPGTDGTPRHASQLYEAFFEGFVLFVLLNLLWAVPSLRRRKGLFVGLFFSLYAAFRFAVEFFREPDVQIGYLAGHLTMGQILCLPMFVFGVCFVLYAALKGKREGNG